MGRSTWGATLLASLAVLGFEAAPAGATFAGGNGRLATAWLDNDQGAHDEAAYAVVTLRWQKRSSGANVVSCTSIDGCPAYAHPAFSPDGTRLVYDKAPPVAGDGSQPKSELVLCAPDGSTAITIADPAGQQNYFEPSFLPSGQRLVFVRSPTVGAQNDPPPHGQLVTTDLTGGNVRVVTSVPAADPVLSPNGRTVLFDHRGGIWAVPIRGGKARRVVRDGGFPDFSPDGRSIVYVSGAKQTLHVARADGTHPRRILGTYPHEHRGHPLRYADYPRYSPDGKQIAFAYYDSEGDPIVARMPAGGGPVRPLWTTPPLDAGGTDLGIAWQPLPSVP